jgi:hypothetical protein
MPVTTLFSVRTLLPSKNMRFRGITLKLFGYTLKRRASDGGLCVGHGRRGTHFLDIEGNMPSFANDNQRGGIAPRGLRRVEAARYLGISPTHFDKQVRAGTVPKPLERFGVNIWDRVALDALFDGVPQAVNDNDDYWDKACGSESQNT